MKTSGEIEINKLSTRQFLILLAVIIIGVAGIIWAVTANNTKSDATVAIVGGEKITKDDLYDVMVERVGEQALDILINEKVLELELEKIGDEVKEEDIEKEMAVHIENFGGEEELEASLEASGMTLEDLRTNIKLSFKYEFATDVTDEEAEEFFNENKTLFDQSKQVATQVILVEDEKTGEDVLSELSKGADFSDLAREHSIHSSAEHGGNTGYVTQVELPEELGNPVFSLKKDEISDLIKTEAGYHIIKVTDIKEETNADFAEMKDQFVEYLRAQKMQLAYQSWMEEKIKEYKVENKLKE